MFSIPSNNGLRTISFEDTGLIPDDGKGPMVAIRLSADFWDRSTSLENARLVPDHAFEFQQVKVPLECLEDLRLKAENWLDNQEPFSARLTVENEAPYIELSISEEKAVISSKQKPVLIFRYRDLQTVLNFKLVMDQTGFRAMFEGLARYLDRQMA